MRDYEIQGIEDDIIDGFKSRFGVGEPKYRHIFIDSGALNDEIIDYELEIHETSRKRERCVKFRTSASVFPKVVSLSDYDSVDTEEFNGSLFVHVH